MQIHGVHACMSSLDDDGLLPAPRLVNLVEQHSKRPSFTPIGRKNVPGAFTGSGYNCGYFTVDSDAICVIATIVLRFDVIIIIILF